MFDYQFIDNVLGSIITNKLATLYELQTIYSYNDIMLLYDIILTNNVNEKIVIDCLVKKGRANV